jgi:hypothetical protein
MLSELDSAELTEWMAFYQLEPFGDLMADRRHGIATSVLANVNRDAKAKPEAYKETDFIYWHDVHSRAQQGKAILLADPEAHSKLIKEALFGVRV